MHDEFLRDYQLANRVEVCEDIIGDVKKEIDWRTIPYEDAIEKVFCTIVVRLYRIVNTASTHSNRSLC